MPGMYSTRGWAVLRERQLAYEPLCAMCREAGRVEPATVVDHIEPHKGRVESFFDEGNLQSLCKPCHDSHKQRAEKSGRLIGCKSDGAPLDASHPWYRETDE